jgi:TolB-like protein/tetratricopeptide (TPR) repeat protein
MADDPLLDDVAGAVLDGDPVDWADVEARADSSATSVVKHLAVLSLVAALHRQNESDALGRPERDETWGHLRLVERIGRGAFGEVYRAWDTRLDREVALKLLPAPAAAGRASSIIEEGRLLARVRHPGVVTIHGAEQIGDCVGLWMEYIRGRTLEELLEKGGTFTPRDVIQIGLDLSKAVAAVHDAGLIHRDIKAHNVIRAEDGRVMLMDFGAGLERVAAASAPAGTPLYLAPELFAGQPATVRSDVYSLGVLLYHLLTGTYPVGGKSLHDVRLTHERGERTALADVRPDLPRRLIRAIEHAIDPQPERRCESAAALGTALRSAQQGSRRRWIVGLAAAAAVFTMWMAQPGRGDTEANRSLADIARARAPAASWWGRLWPAKRIAIAVLPFQNLGTVTDGDLMADGLTDELTSILATVNGLGVRSATSSFAFKGKPRDLAAIRRDLTADVVVDGELFASGDRVRVVARLVSVPDGVSMLNQTFERPGKDVLGIQHELALAIANRLGLELGGDQRRYEIDPVLLMKFLKARRLARLGPPFSIEAISLFEEIVEQAPMYAPAWAGLASLLSARVRLEGESATVLLPQMTVAAHEAYRLDPMLAEANAAMGLLAARDLHWNEAEVYFRQALGMNPSITTVHIETVTFLLLPLDRLDDALELLAVASSVDPLSLHVPRLLAQIQVEARKFEEAIRTALSVLERDPNLPYVRPSLGRALALSGRHDEALAIFKTERDGPGYMGYVYAVTGRRDDAEALAAKMQEDSRPAFQFLIYAGLGDKERAFQALELVYARNPWRAATWMMRPEVAILRDDPRFGEFRRRLLRIPN